MTYITHKIKAAAILMGLAATTLCVSTPASAGTQDEVHACRVAIAYRLRFERKKGYRNQTLYLKAIPKKGGESFRFTCHFNRTNVVALNRKDGIRQFALKKDAKS